MKQTDLNYFDLRFRFTDIASMMTFVALCDQHIRQYGFVEVTLKANEDVELEE